MPESWLNMASRMREHDRPRYAATNNFSGRHYVAPPRPPARIPRASHRRRLHANALRDCAFRLGGSPAQCKPARTLRNRVHEHRRTRSPVPRRCRTSGATGPRRRISCTTHCSMYASRMPNTMLNWNRPVSAAAAIRWRDFRDVDRREHRGGADRKATDETEHVERFEVPAERAAQRGDDVHEADRFQRIARTVSIARDAGQQRADERAEQALATEKPYQKLPASR